MISQHAREAMKALLASTQSISPGFRASIPYDKALVASEEDGGEAKEITLAYHYPYQAFGDPRPPRVLKAKVDKGKVLYLPVEDAPFVRHTRTIKNCEVQDGVLVRDDPTRSPIIMDEYEGLVRGEPTTLQIPAEQTSDPKFWNSRGFLATQKGLQELQRITAASCHAGISSVVHGTYEKGWIRMRSGAPPCYIYGETVILPENSEELIALSRSGSSQGNLGVGQAGTLEGSAMLLAAALHNPAFATLAGFACSAVLLAVLFGMEPGIINLVGASGSGKTTLLQLIASLLGIPGKPSSPSSYIGTWRATDNGMEAPLAARSDSVSILDEVHQAPANTDWQSALYMAANGRGKARMTKETEAREPKAWRTQLISSGEESLASKVRNSRFGKTQMPGGLQFRVIDVDAATAGLWSDVGEQAQLPYGGRYRKVAGITQEATNARAIIEGLERAALANYGHAWPKIIRYLQDEKNRQAAQTLFNNYRRVLEDQCDEGTSQIVRRRIKHVAAALTGLALLMSALEMADQTIIEKAREWASKHLWKAGLEYTTGSEGDEMVERFTERLLAEPSRLFRQGIMPSHRDYWGWHLEQGQVFLPTGTGINAICADLGLDRERVRAALLANGWTADQKRPPVAGVRGTSVRGLVSPPGLLGDWLGVAG